MLNRATIISSIALSTTLLFSPAAFALDDESVLMTHTQSKANNPSRDDGVSSPKQNPDLLRDDRESGTVQSSEATVVRVRNANGVSSSVYRTQARNNPDRVIDTAPSTYDN